MFTKYDQKIVNKMLQMGFHMSNKGFCYILEATEIINNSGEFPKVAGRYGLYSMVGEVYGTTGSRVERCIRAEVERYYSSHIEVPAELVCDEASGKLPNKEFLARMARILYSK